MIENDGDQLEQTPISNYSCDPLQGIGGPMTRGKTKRMEQALQGLIMEMQAKEAVQNESDALPRLITFLHCADAKKKIWIKLGAQFTCPRWMEPNLHVLMGL